MQSAHRHFMCGSQRDALGRRRENSFQILPICDGTDESDRGGNWNLRQQPRKKVCLRLVTDKWKNWRGQAAPKRVVSLDETPSLDTRMIQAPVFGSSSEHHPNQHRVSELECWFGTRPAKSQLNLGHPHNLSPMGGSHPDFEAETPSNMDVNGRTGHDQDAH